MNKATAFCNRLLLALSTAGATVWRNNTGQAWAGRSIRLNAGDVYRAQGGERVVLDPRPLHAGLCKGSGDIIGIVPVEVRADMIGRTVGVFVSVEAKTGSGRASKEQKTFAEHVKACGGRAVIAHNEKEALSVLE
ncbi:hypothetical protein [Breoghania sp.]|uniref:hypothetical protein n=1 Tax=Breoghania sp. TaxID=2065378 RepID=UPI002AA78FA5|nr:hypothetical protein [Breoghania sp.]